MIDYAWLAFHTQCDPLDEKQQALLEKVIRIRTIPPGVPVIHQGRGGEALYLLRAGQVKIVRKNDDGTKTELAAPKNLRIFGEMSFFSNEPANADVIADTSHCTIYKIDHDGFERLLQEEPALAMSLMTMVVRSMGDAIRRMDNRFARIY